MNFVENLRNFFLILFQNGRQPYQQAPVNNVNKNVVYPKQFFDMNKFKGSWVEVARTSNPLQQFDNEEAVHEFISNPSNSYQMRHKIKQGRKKINHMLNIDSNSKDMILCDDNNNYFGSPSKAHLIGIYDQMLNLVTQPDTQPCTYCMLAQGNDKLWMLSRPGYENNSQAIAHMMNFAQKLGYKMKVTNPNLIQQIKNKPTDEITVVWNLKSFPEDGSGRTVNINKDNTIRFKSTDGMLHTVAQADIVEDGKWVPNSDPKIQSPPSSLEFNRTLKIGEPGIYYLACPVGTHHKIMRLKVNVRDS